MEIKEKGFSNKNSQVIKRIIDFKTIEIDVLAIYYESLAKGKCAVTTALT